jgi:hypothetical protein
VARKTIELFNAFVGAKFTYQELTPSPLKLENMKPETVKPAEAKLAQRPTEGSETCRRGTWLKTGGKKPTAKPETVKPGVGKSRVLKPEVAEA